MTFLSRFTRLFRALHADARHWQIVALSGLFVIAWRASDFGTSPVILATAISGALLAEILATLWIARGVCPKPAMQWKSALITALGIALLLRASDLWIWFAAAAIAILGKSLLRVNGKHIFNPACSGIIAVLLLCGNEAWVSPGQWGQASLAAGYALAMAALTLSSARRLDIALGFLGCFALLHIGRGWWLGDPLNIALHQLTSGSLVIFAFFMITDPRSTPDSRAGRLVFAAAVAVVAAALQWGPNLRAAPLMALAIVGLFTPIIDRLWPATRFAWSPSRPAVSSTSSPTPNTMEAT